VSVLWSFKRAPGGCVWMATVFTLTPGSVFPSRVMYGANILPPAVCCFSLH
jgi:hypothetical protein